MAPATDHLQKLEVLKAGACRIHHLGESGQDAAGVKAQAVAPTNASNLEGWALQHRSTLANLAKMLLELKSQLWLPQKLLLLKV